MTINAEITIAPSGKTVLARIVDDAGNPAPVRKILSGDEIQQFTITALPAGGTFSLEAGGSTTAGILVTALPPSTYATWTKSDCVPGRAYRVSQISNQGSPAAVYLVYDGAPLVDGSNVLATLTVQQARWPVGTAGTITDGTTPDGIAAVWHDLGSPTGLTPTGTTLTVRVAGPNDPNNPFLGADAIRFEDLTTHVVDYIDDRDGRFATVGVWTSLAESPQTANFLWAGTERTGTGSGTGNRFACDPAAVRSDYEALPAIGAGNVLVVAGGADDTGPFTLHYTGSLAGRAVAVPTSSDAAVVVSETSAGGQYPSISIAGGASIPLASPIWTAGAAFIAYPTFQSSPPVRTLVFDQDNFVHGPGWEFPVAGGYGAGYIGQSATVGTGCVATWKFPGLRPGETFQVGATWPSDPSYSAAATWNVTDLDGNHLAGPFVLSQKSDPAGISHGGRPWTPLATVTTPADGGIAVVLTNGDGDPLVADSAILTRTSVDASVVVRSGDAVTFSAPTGWVATDSGPLPAVAALAATNLAGQAAIVPFDAVTPKTMGTGYNVMGALAGGPVPPYSNICKNAQLGGDVLATDANGNPTRFGVSTSICELVGFWQDGKGLGRGLPVYPNGDFAVVWDGSPDRLALAGEGNTACVERTELATSAGGRNKRVFTLTEGINYSPIVTLRWLNTAVGDGTFANDATNIQVYPPGIDPDNPPKFHPRFLAMLAGVKSLRFMDALNAIGGGCVDYADYQQPGRFSYFMPVRTVDVQVASITGYTGSDTFFDASKTAVLLVTTATPHTLSDGQFAAFSACGVVQFSDVASDGDTRDMILIGGLLHKLSDTTLLIECQRNTGFDSPRMINTLTPANGRLTSSIGGSAGNGAMPLLDCVELCNTQGCNFQLNVCNSVTDACMDAIGDAVAGSLNAGLKCRFEFCNEPWNTIGSRAYLCAMSAALIPGHYDDPYPGYVNRAARCFERLQGRFAAAARPDDVLFVLGGQRAGGNTIDSILQWSAADQYNAPFDEICVDGYFDPLPGFNADGSLTAIFNGLDTDQDVDLIEITNEYASPDAGAIAGVVAKLQAAIANGQAKPTARISVYEGGFDTTAMPGVTLDYNARSFAAVRHPRAFGIMFRMLQRDQDAGVVVFHQYALNIGLGAEMWNTYWGLGVDPGTGDPIADAANITDPLALNVTKTQVGGAMLLWASLVPATGPVTPPSRTPARWGRLRRVLRVA